MVKYNNLCIGNEGSLNRLAIRMSKRLFDGRVGLLLAWQANMDKHKAMKAPRPRMHYVDIAKLALTVLAIKSSV